jgi:hypothetical protein
MHIELYLYYVTFKLAPLLYHPHISILSSLVLLLPWGFNTLGSLAIIHGYTHPV